MKITMKNGITFEGTQAEYEEFLAYVERKIAEDEEKEAQVEETIEFEGAKYRKVEREAREGDVVTYASPAHSYVTKGKPYKVLSRNRGLRILDEDGDELRVYNGYSRTRETVDVYEPIEQAKYTPKEGDIVVITGNRCDSRNAVGDIGKIKKVKSYGINVEVPSKPDGSGVNGNSHTFDEVRKATPAEVEKYEQAVKDANMPKLKAGDYVKITNGTPSIIEGEIYEVLNDEENELHILDKDGDSRYFPLVMGHAKYEILSAEEAKWAKIGRKPNEFKKGDVVRVLGTCNGHEIAGQLGEVVVPDCTDRPFVRAVYSDELVSLYSRIELVAPVESLFNA